jgi:hypothetical protein
VAFAFRDARVVGPRSGHLATVSRRRGDREDKGALGQDHEVHERGDVRAPQGFDALMVNLDDCAYPCDAGEPTNMDRESTATAVLCGWQAESCDGGDREVVRKLVER